MQIRTTRAQYGLLQNMRASRSLACMAIQPLSHQEAVTFLSNTVSTLATPWRKWRFSR